MSRPRLARCFDHRDAPHYTCSRCVLCCALRGTVPTATKSGTTGHQRGHPERLKPELLSVAE